MIRLGCFLAFAKNEGIRGDCNNVESTYYVSMLFHSPST